MIALASRRTATPYSVQYGGFPGAAAQVAGGARAGPLLPLDIHHELRTPSPFLGELASKGLVTGSMLPARCSRLNLTPSSCAVPIWLVVGLALAVQCCESVTAPIEKSQLSGANAATGLFEWHRVQPTAARS